MLSHPCLQLSGVPMNPHDYGKHTLAPTFLFISVMKPVTTALVKMMQIAHYKRLAHVTNKHMGKQHRGGPMRPGAQRHVHVLRNKWVARSTKASRGHVGIHSAPPTNILAPVWCHPEEYILPLWRPCSSFTRAWHEFVGRHVQRSWPKRLFRYRQLALHYVCGAALRRCPMGQ